MMLDIERIRRLASRTQPVLLRVTPGIRAHTHDAIATGHAGSKFGVPLDQAPALIERIRREPSMRLDGLHMHIGSQIFELRQFREAIIALAALGRFAVYELGGGLAARYTSADPPVRIDDYARILVKTVHAHLGEDVRLLIEPGRSLDAPTAVSLYTVVTIKHGARTHVAVDDGMGDNLEVSLYGQRFQPWLLDGDGPIGRLTGDRARERGSGDAHRAGPPARGADYAASCAVRRTASGQTAPTSKSPSVNWDSLRQNVRNPC